MSEWLPIDSAPKDGTRVDLWVVGYSDEPQRMTGAWFSHDCWWHSAHDDVWPIDRNDGGLPATVTNWMPLPPPPTETGAS